MTAAVLGDPSGGAEGFAVEWQIEAEAVSPAPPAMARLLGRFAPVDASLDLRILDDPLRLDALHRLGILDRQPRRNLDRLVRLVCDLLDAPIGLLTLVDAHRQFFYSCYGLPQSLASARQTGLDHSICQYAVASGRPLIVTDTADDPTLAANPAVTELGVKAYAGIPLITSTGHAIGTLCVIDVVSRDWDDHQLAVLARVADLATQTCTALEARSMDILSGEVMAKAGPEPS